MQEESTSLLALVLDQVLAEPVPVVAVEPESVVVLVAEGVIGNNYVEAVDIAVGAELVDNNLVGPAAAVAVVVAVVVAVEVSVVPNMLVVAAELQLAVAVVVAEKIYLHEVADSESDVLMDLASYPRDL